MSRTSLLGGTLVPGVGFVGALFRSRMRQQHHLNHRSLFVVQLGLKRNSRGLREFTRLCIVSPGREPYRQSPSQGKPTDLQSMACGKKALLDEALRLDPVMRRLV